MVAIGNGLTKLNIPNAKTRNDASKAGDSSNANTFKATVAKNLSTASKATGSTSRNIIYTSRDFGIGAQRSIFGSGMAWNARKYNEKSIGINREVLSYESKSLKEAQEAKYARLYRMSQASYGNQNQVASNDTLSMLMLANTFATQMAKSKSANKSSSNDGAGSTTNTANVVKTEVGEILGQLNSAKSSGDVEKALGTINTKLQNIETETPKLQKEVADAKTAKQNAETKLNDTNSQITSEKQNVQKQEGQINKLGSQISSLEASIGDISNQILNVDAQIAKAMGATPKQDTSALESKKRSLEALKEQKETELSETKQKKKDAEKSKQASETKLKDQLEPAKEKLEKEVSDSQKTVEEGEAKLNKMESQKNELTKAKTDAETKLTKQNKQDSSKLTSLKEKADKYADEYKKETKPDKKNKILAKYTAVANEYNTLASNLSSDLKDKYSTIAGTIE